ARKQTKKEMAVATGHLKSILNSKQLAIKLSANSVYGLTGNDTSMLVLKCIARSTTAFGRKMLMRTRELVAELYPTAQVIYGDTDSVMVKLQLPATMEGIKKAWEIGEEAAHA